VRIDCKQASRLLSAELDGRLSITQRAALRLHLTLCDACTNVKAQFEFLRRALRTYGRSKPGDDEPR
jgi:anti-sigma factor RsiW